MNLDRPPATPEQMRAAQEFVNGQEILIDNNALASIAEDGVWVQAWVWVPNEDLS